MINIRPANPMMMEEFLNVKQEQSIKAYFLMDGVLVLGVGGYYQSDGKGYVFTQLTRELRERKDFSRAMVILGRQLLRLMNKGGITAYAIADPDYKKSGPMLEHFGFEHYEGNYYRWQTQLLH